MASVRVVAILLVCSSVVVAGEAVSGLNGKTGFAYGNMDGDSGRNVLGSVSLPLTDNFGFQADGLYTNVSDRDFYAVGGHLFWRDWDKGLLGVAGAALHESDIDSSLIGLEGECYLDRFTLAAGAGVASIEYEESVPFIDTDATDFFGSVGLRYYPLDDLMVSGSYLYVFDNSLFLGELEYQTPVDGVSLFAEFAGGENDYEHALFGVQFYLGKPKTLIRRHREDDPPSIVQRALYAVGAYGAEYNKRGQEYAEAQGTDYSGSYGLVVTNMSYGGIDTVTIFPGGIE